MKINYDKNNYVIHIRSLKQALNPGLILKKVHRAIQFNKEAGLKKYIDINTELRKQGINDFQQEFLKLITNFVFEKTMENVRKHRDIKLVITDKRRNELVSEPNYHTIKGFSEKLLATEMKKTKIKINKPVYLGLSMLEISKILIINFGMTTLNQSIKTMQNYATWVQTALLFILKLKIFMKILQMILKKDLIQTMNAIDH